MTDRTQICYGLQNNVKQMLVKITRAFGLLFLFGGLYPKQIGTGIYLKINVCCRHLITA